MQQNVSGVIKKVKYENKYMIIEDKYVPEETYLGLFSECKEYISPKEDYIGREVQFIPVEEDNKKKAKCISFKTKK